MTEVVGGLRPRRRIDALRRRFTSQAEEPAPAQRPAFQRLLIDVVDTYLADRPTPLTVIISDRDRSQVEGWVRELMPGARIHRLQPGDQVVPETVALGHPDLIIDEGEDGRRLRRMRGNLMLLCPGGVAMARLPRPGRRRVDASAEQKAITDLAMDATTGVFDKGAGLGKEPKKDREYVARVAAEFRASEGHYVVVRRQKPDPIAVRVREEWSETLIAGRGIGTVRTVSEPTTFASRGSVTVSESDFRGPYATSWDVPAMLVRTYDDVVSAPGQVVHRDDLILPESFRHPPKERMGHDTMAVIAQDFGDPTVPSAYTEPSDGPVPVLEGAYFHLDNEFRGHFGHLLTESVSRLWAWPEAKAQNPDLKVLLHPNSRPLAEYELAIYEAAGVAREDVVLVPHPVRVERLIGATQMFCNPHYVHPGVGDMWRQIGDRLAGQATGDGPRPRRIFIGRRIEKRPCRNAAEVEAFFEGLGFTVVFPEDYSLGDQVRLFREAEVIAGYAGSGLFTAMFVSEPKTMLIVTSESYFGENEILIGAVLGHDIHVGFASSEGKRRGTGWAGGSYHAPFTLDLERTGEVFRSAVDGL